MKKLFSIVIVLISVLTGCGTSQEGSVDLDGADTIDDGTTQIIEEAHYLTGELQEIKGNSVLINSEEAGLVWVAMAADTDDLNIAVRSKIKIEFNGVIAESYPAQATGISIEVIEPFTKEAIYTMEELTTLVTNGEEMILSVWNDAMDYLAFTKVDAEINDSYRVYIANIYDENRIEVAKVNHEIPSMTWWYDRLQISTSLDSVEIGPDFNNINDLVTITGIQTEQVELDQLDYEIELKVYEDTSKGLSIDYFQIKNLENSTMLASVNQALYAIVENFGSGYDNVTIEASVLRQDRLITVFYEGTIGSWAYINYVTIDVTKGIALNFDHVVSDYEEFSGLFEEVTSYKLGEQEGVQLYFTQDFMGLTFVPTDGSAGRKFYEIPLMDLESILKTDYSLTE